MELCIMCMSKGYCRKRTTLLVTDDEIASAEFIRDVRATAAHLNVGNESWVERLADMYRDYIGWIMDPGTGAEVFLDIEQFDDPNLRFWFRDFCKPSPPEVKPRVRSEARERVRTLATILRATHPKEAMIWGVRPANDNSSI